MITELSQIVEIMNFL